MSTSTADLDEAVTEFELPEGCPLCGGTLAVRTTPEGAGSYCGHCHWLSRPRVRLLKGRVEMAHPAPLLA